MLGSRKKESTVLRRRLLSPCSLWIVDVLDVYIELVENDEYIGKEAEPHLHNGVTEKFVNISNFACFVHIRMTGEVGT